MSTYPPALKSTRWALLFVLALGMSLLSLACTIARPNWGDDDDSGSSEGDDDDDDTSVGDDDDTSVGDDDDTSGGSTLDLEALTFAMEITASQTSLGTGLAATFIFSYWETYNETSQTLMCNQRVEIEGTATFAADVMANDGCTNCTGRLLFDESTRQDVSDPTIQPDDCDLATLQAGQSDFGTTMLTPTGDTGYGDFLDIPLIDAGSYATLGLEASQDGANPYDAAGISTSLSGLSLEFTHVGYTSNAAGTLSDSSGLATVAEDAGAGGAGYFAYFMIGKVTGNTTVGSGMDGDYIAQPIWLVNFTAQ